MSEDDKYIKPSDHITSDMIEKAMTDDNWHFAQNLNAMMRLGYCKICGLVPSGCKNEGCGARQMTQQEINKRICKLAGVESGTILTTINLSTGKSNSEYYITLDILMRAVFAINDKWVLNSNTGWCVKPNDMLTAYCAVKSKDNHMIDSALFFHYTDDTDSKTESLRKAVSYCVENMEE
jgi:hypothetical protein